MTYLLKNCLQEDPRKGSSMWTSDGPCMKFQRILLFFTENGSEISAFPLSGHTSTQSRATSALTRSFELDITTDAQCIRGVIFPAENKNRGHAVAIS